VDDLAECMLVFCEWWSFQIRTCKIFVVPREWQGNVLGYIMGWGLRWLLRLFELWITMDAMSPSSLGSPPSDCVDRFLDSAPSALTRTDTRGRLCGRFRAGVGPLIKPGVNVTLFELPELFLDSGADETEVSQVVSKWGPGEFPPVWPGVVDLLLPV